MSFSLRFTGWVVSAFLAVQLTSHDVHAFGRRKSPKPVPTPTSTPPPAPIPPPTPTPSPEPTFRPRAGLVRGAGTNSIYDDQGPFNGLGATLFWATWAYRHDRVALERDLKTLAQNGFDYIRVLGTVGCDGPGNIACGSSAIDNWDGKEADWRWPDYDLVIAGLTDLVYDKYGMRIQWTLIGDGQHNVPNRNDRFNLVDTFIRMSQGREHKIMHFEIANESWQNGFDGDDGLAQLRELTRYLKDRTEILVAASAPGGFENECLGLEAVYGGDVADMATVHFDRDIGKAEGAWRPVRQPWGYKDCNAPRLASNNEPIGPGSSVADEKDPLKLATAAVASYIARLPFYVFHTRRGVGIGERFGLRSDQPMAEMPGVDAYRAMKAILPPGLSAWNMQNHYWAGHPFRTYGDGIENNPWPDGGASNGIVRHFAVTTGDRFVTVLIGIRVYVDIEAKDAMEFDAVHPVTGAALGHYILRGGERTRIQGTEAAVLIGRNGPPGIYPPGTTPNPKLPPSPPKPTPPPPPPGGAEVAPNPGICGAGSTFYANGWPTRSDCNRKKNEGGFSGSCEQNATGCFGVP